MSFNTTDLTTYPSLEGVGFQEIPCETDEQCQTENPILACETFTGGLGKLCSCQLQLGRYGPDCLGSLSGAMLLQPVLLVIMQVFIFFHLLKGVKVLLRTLKKSKVTSLDSLAIVSSILSITMLSIANINFLVVFFTMSNTILNTGSIVQRVVLGPAGLAFGVISVCIVSASWLQVIERNPFEKLHLNLKSLKALFSGSTGATVVLVPLMMSLRMYEQAGGISTLICAVIGVTNYYIGKKLKNAIGNISVVGTEKKKSQLSSKKSSRKGSRFSFTKAKVTNDEEVHGGQQRQSGSSGTSTMNQRMILVFQRLEIVTLSLTRRCALLILVLVGVIGMVSAPGGQSRIHLSYWIVVPLHFTMFLLPATVVDYNHRRIQNANMIRASMSKKDNSNTIVSKKDGSTTIVTTTN